MRRIISPAGPPIGKIATASPPSACTARATLIPPPPGSYRGGEHRNLCVGITRSVDVAMSSAGFIVNVTIVPIGMRLLCRERAGSCCLLRLMHHNHGTQEACRVDADRVDPELGQKTGDFRIVCRRFAADPDVTMVALGAGHRKPQHFEHAGVALIEIES